MTLEQTIFSIVGAVVKDAPEAIDIFERAIAHHKAPRVEEIRPPVSASEVALEEITARHVLPTDK